MLQYYNDSQEIDIELLSRQYANGTDPPSAPLNMVLHTALSNELGFQTPNTSTYGQPVVPVSLYDSFHEFRIDWTPGKASFYFDGEWTWDLEDSNVPVEPSTMLLSHWSNGAPGWSQGPPLEDAVMTISYFKAYFNSSDAKRTEDYTGRCKDPSELDAVCVIPDQKGAPDGANAGTFFFSAQKNQTVNQTVYTGLPSAGAQLSVWSWLPTWVIGVVWFLASGLFL